MIHHWHQIFYLADQITLADHLRRGGGPTGDGRRLAACGERQGAEPRERRDGRPDHCSQPPTFNPRAKMVPHAVRPPRHYCRPTRSPSSPLAPEATRPPPKTAERCIGSAARCRAARRLSVQRESIYKETEVVDRGDLKMEQDAVDFVPRKPAARRWRRSGGRKWCARRGGRDLSTTTPHATQIPSCRCSPPAEIPQSSGRRPQQSRQ